MPHYDFFQNRECEFFPCHKTSEPQDFNCLFCYCPLYALGDKCGGNYTYIQNGTKDCSKCLFPHRRANYPAVCSKLQDILELTKKNPNEEENP